MPRLEKTPLRSDAVPMVGQRFGVVTVEAFAGRLRFPSQSHLMWRVRCTRCNHRFLADGGSLRNAAPRQSCRKCQDVAQSVKLSDGRSLVEVARDAKLKLNTVWKRYVRGWPESELGTELRIVRHPSAYVRNK